MDKQVEKQLNVITIKIGCRTSKITLLFTLSWPSGNKLAAVEQGYYMAYISLTIILKQFESKKKRFIFAFL